MPSIALNNYLGDSSTKGYTQASIMNGKVLTKSSHRQPYLPVGIKPQANAHSITLPITKNACMITEYPYRPENFLKYSKLISLQRCKLNQCEEKFDTIETYTYLVSTQHRQSILDTSKCCQYLRKGSMNVKLCVPGRTHGILIKSFLYYLII